MHHLKKFWANKQYHFKYKNFFSFEIVALRILYKVLNVLFSHVISQEDFCDGSDYQERSGNVLFKGVILHKIDTG